MVGARGEGDFGTDMVQYGTAVRVPLLGLSSGVKRRIWRDRQIQTQAYNWGIEYALVVHNSGERIPSPRNHSAPLTQFRHQTGSVHNLRLQRGGFWCAVEAVKRWPKRRNQLVYGQRKATEGTDKATEGTDKALADLGALLERLAGEGSDVGGEAMSVHSCAMSDAMARYRGAHRRRIELVECGGNSVSYLWPTPPSSALDEMPSDERAEKVSEATAGADRALESFNVALRALIDSVNGTEAARKRLRDLADKVHRAAAAEAKATRSC